MKRIVDRYDKSHIADLPRAVFPGHIEVITSERDAERAVHFLQKQPILGFDTETRPSFTKGRQYSVALLQVSSQDVCFLFRLNQIGFPVCLVNLLRDDSITKVGLSWHIEDRSLQKLYANLLGKKISKGQQLTNWEADSLSESQQQYAATDAWACVQLYKEMMRMQKEGFELEVKKDEETD